MPRRIIEPIEQLHNLVDLKVWLAILGTNTVGYFVNLITALEAFRLELQVISLLVGIAYVLRRWWILEQYRKDKDSRKDLEDSSFPK